MERTIRPARTDDVPVILRMIHDLARFERLEHQLHTDEEALREHLFGRHPVCEAIVAEVEAPRGASHAAPGAGGGPMRPVGFALFFAAYSTFETGPFLYLEDLWVDPDARGHGHGQALLEELVRIARERGWPRVQWAVLDWNQRAIDFYRSFGAEVLTDWRLCRVATAARG